MEILGVIVVLLIAFPAAVVASRFRPLLIAVGLGMFALGWGALAYLEFGPKDLLVRYPALTNVLHPYLVGSYFGVGVVFGTGLLLGVLAQVVRERLRLPRQRLSGRS